MSQKTYLIKLKPIGSYFFGQENYSDTDRRAFYLQHSAILPQQTTILGMLRHQLLLQNGYLERKNNQGSSQYQIKERGKASVFIGTHSFEMEGNHSYGVVKKLSPLFLIKDDKQFFAYPKIKYFANPEDRKKDVFSYKEINLSLPSFNTGELGYSLMGDHLNKRLLVDPNYNSKHGFELGFRSIDGKDFIRFNDVFVDNKGQLEQVGIYKTQTIPYRNLEENSQDEGFFKLVYNRLQEGWSFGVFANFEDANYLNSTTVIMGKERSTFHMEVEASTWPNYFLNDTDSLQGQTLWLLSDSYFDPKQLYQNCEFVYLEEKSFRNIRSSISGSDTQFTNYFGKPRRSNSDQKDSEHTLRFSNRYNFFKRGGLIKLKDDIDQKVIQSLLFQKNLQKIGYNFFYPLKLNS